MRDVTPRHRLLVAGLLCLATGLLAAPSPAQARTAPACKAASAAFTAKKCDTRPNILVVMTDDEALADQQHMPNVRKLLGQQGTTFANAVDSFPLCCPARATFITGQYAHNHGVNGNFFPYGWYGMKDRGNILPRWLQKSGYTTALFGKWLNGYGAMDAHGEIPVGFDIWGGLLDPSAYDYFNFEMNLNGELRTWGDATFAKQLVQFGNVQVKPVYPRPSLSDVINLAHSIFTPGDFGTTVTPTSPYSPDVTGKMTESLVKDQAKSKKPFFIWWAPASAHREDVATSFLGRPGQDPRPSPKYEAKSKTFTLPTPPSFDDANVGKPSKIADLPPLTDAKKAQLQLDYEGRIGSLQTVDEHVATLVKTLKATHQLKNTMIVFVSDNGWVQGQHRIPGDKFVPYEESLKVPFILRGPSIPVGRTVKNQVSNIDFASTILAAAQTKPGRVQDGINLLPVARDPKKTPARAIGIEATSPLFIGEGFPMQYDQPYTGVRTDSWKYVEWNYGPKELYDLKADPYELHNLADLPADAGIQAALAAKVRKLEHCKGGQCHISGKVAPLS